MDLIWGEATANSAGFYKKVLQSGTIKDLFVINREAMRGILRRYNANFERQLAEKSEGT